MKILNRFFNRLRRESAPFQIEARGNVKYYTKNGVLQSIYPPQSRFNFTYWSAMIPPFQPKTVLILGYGMGTIASLIRLVWGKEIVITGVDILNCEDITGFYSPTIYLQSDAVKFIQEKGLSLFEYIVIDLSIGKKFDDVIFRETFVNAVKLRAEFLVSINLLIEEDYKLTEWRTQMKEERVIECYGQEIVFFSK